MLRGTKSFTCESLIISMGLMWLSMLEIIQVCERSLPLSHGDPVVPPSEQFIRGNMQASGYLIRPYGTVGSIVYIVDHMDLKVKFFQSF